jgi:transcriptional regulator with XRE-family HTH domain
MITYDWSAKHDDERDVMATKLVAKITPHLRAVPAAPKARTRSAGSVALQALTVPQTEVAARLGVDQSLVARWGLGERMPAKSQRRIMVREWDIPFDAWEKEPGHPPTPNRAKMASLSPEIFQSQTQALYEEIEIMRQRAAYYRDNGDPKMYVRHMKDATAMHGLLAKLLGMTLEINEERAARLPAVRRILERVFAAVSPYPEAFAAAKKAVE